MSEDAKKELEDGIQLLNEGRAEEAIKKFSKVTKIDPKNAEAYFWKAEASLALSQVTVEEILALYKKAIEYDPNNAYYQSSLGFFCAENGRFNEAEAAYNRAAELDPESSSQFYSEFASEYARKAPVFMERFLDEKTREMIQKKALKYALKSIMMDEETAKKLLV
ncbi:MAG: tetratricopeptide repeat protein [Candidatus Thermoplasmatota archaeon]|nr:tetratricopeptide repeat protein [Candidatus Thermoplasmatota archaeon]MCL5437214.1 tetratricopeptide repeat protein [Candidatus Thermoplasmatota archaeon]